MEVAGQWRRQWAGTAEYGKVTEGGVTRRVARAMEVLHASAPGAKVRVMRAAYHSTAGPGTPASSYMVHSSRRVISSGFNFLDAPPTITTKPLEISSIPYEHYPESTTETSNYKVTEPDDTEISEPSKWRGSSATTSLRMPSEESSSTADNVSIIDLDPKIREMRKSSSESSDTQTMKRNSIEIPVHLSPLSTLKYKSLLNGSSDWRRKSYSFEDTAPLNETIIHANDTLAMESSTDSGICKSTEIVNELEDKSFSVKNEEDKDESFRDWLLKNRQNSLHKRSSLPNDTPLNIDGTSNVALKSIGRVSIALPVTVEKEDNFQYKGRYVSEDGDRKTKRVEFCKTELHFAAESGTVNIIATDEKPPPTNDFRKRRSAFVPIANAYEKPITLFGDNTHNLLNSDTNSKSFSAYITNENSDNDENTAATKSILKNKIPKPKPYLLGENMVLGESHKDLKNVESCKTTPPSAVSIINRELESYQRPNSLTKLSNDFYNTNESNHATLTSNKDHANIEGVKRSIYGYKNISTLTKSEVHSETSDLTKRPNMPSQIKARQLRENELPYFGLSNLGTKNNSNESIYSNYELPTEKEEIFHSVKLVKQIESSACNSEAESEDLAEYQNIPNKTNFAPIPAPRYSTRKKDPLKIITEENFTESRRSKLRRHCEVLSSPSRSISEPPKRDRNRLNKVVQKQVTQKEPENEHATLSRHPKSQSQENIDRSCKPVTRDQITDNSIPIYVNLQDEKAIHNRARCTPNKSTEILPKQRKTNSYSSQNNSYKLSSNRKKLDEKNYHTQPSPPIGKAKKTERNDNTEEKHSIRRTRPQRTEKLSTPETPTEKVHSEKTFNKDKSRTERVHTRNPIVNSHNDIKRVNKNELIDINENPEENIHSRSRNIRKENSLNRNRQSSSTRGRSKTDKAVGETSDSGNYTHSSVSKNISKYDSLKDSITNKHKQKRSEYVINYDDKKGTVSSICKITPASTASKRNKVKDLKNNTKASDKISLLQIPEQDRKHYDFSYGHKKSKKKVHLQRSCQLL